MKEKREQKNIVRGCINIVLKKTPKRKEISKSAENR